MDFQIIGDAEYSPSKVYGIVEDITNGDKFVNLGYHGISGILGLPKHHIVRLFNGDIRSAQLIPLRNLRPLPYKLNYADLIFKGMKISYYDKILTVVHVMYYAGTLIAIEKSNGNNIGISFESLRSSYANIKVLRDFDCNYSMVYEEKAIREGHWREGENDYPLSMLRMLPVTIHNPRHPISSPPLHLTSTVPTEEITLPFNEVIKQKVLISSTEPTIFSHIKLPKL